VYFGITVNDQGIFQLPRRPRKRESMTLYTIYRARHLRKLTNTSDSFKPPSTKHSLTIAQPGRNPHEPFTHGELGGRSFHEQWRALRAHNTGRQSPQPFHAVQRCSRTRKDELSSSSIDSQLPSQEWWLPHFRPIRPSQKAHTYNNTRQRNDRSKL
jgi:hypothetical protein